MHQLSPELGTSTVTSERSIRRYIAVFSAFALAAMAACAIVNYVNDPFQYFAAQSRPRFSNVMQRLQAPGIIRNYPFSSVVVGNSLSANMRPEMFSERAVINLAMWGATLQESAIALELALRAKPVKDVFWQAIGMTSTSNFPANGFPYCLYNRFGEHVPICYLLSAGVAWESLAMILRSSDLSRAGFVPYLRDWKTYTAKPIDVKAYACQFKPDLAQRIGEMTEQTLGNMKTKTLGEDTKRFAEIVLPIVDRWPDVTFYFFFPPIYRPQFWYQGAAGALRHNYEREQVLWGRPNVVIHDFAEYTEITTAPERYSDPHHIDLTAAQWMASSFLSFRSRLKSLEQGEEILEREFRAGGADLQAMLAATHC